MSQHYRHRLAGAAFAALVAAVPLFAAEVAYADRAGSGGQVVFEDGDGVLGLSCAVDPEVRAVTVPTEGTLEVVNGTDHGADLLLDGESQGAIPPNSAAHVVFHRGPVALTVRPDCVLSRESEPVIVTVTPTPSASEPGAPRIVPPPLPPPVDPDATDPSLPVDSSASGPPSVQGLDTGLPGVGLPDAGEAATPSPGRSSTRQSAGRSTSATQGGGAPRSTSTRTTALDQATVGMPPGDHAVVTGDPPVDGSVVATGTSGGAAAEPVAKLEPVSNNRPLGLLALAAAVCVIGVSTGAIRAIVAQRANRADIA